MFIIAKEGKEHEGAYSVVDEDGDSILYIFEEEDDAVRFGMMLEDAGSPEMNIVEVEEELLIQACEIHGHQYIIFDSNDIVIPPEENDSF